MRSRPATSRSMSGPPKRKCQSSGFLRISSHGPTPGTGASISTKRANPVGMLGGEGKADHVADIVGDEVGALDSELVEHAGDVAGLGLLVEAARRLRRQAEAAQVGNDDRVVAHQIGRHRRPHVAGLAIAVQQHDRRPLAADANVDGRAVGAQFLGYGMSPGRAGLVPMPATGAAPVSVAVRRTGQGCGSLRFSRR